MKTHTIKFFIFIVLFLTKTIISQAQNTCNEFYNITEGTQYKIENYNAQSKLTSFATYLYTGVSQTANGFTTNINTESFDAKGKSMVKGTSNLKCTDGVVQFDMRTISMPDMQAMESNPQAQVVVSGDALELPNQLTVGQTLKGVTYNIKISLSGVNLMNRDFTIKDRKVEAYEKVTTPAGTFDAYKISYLVDTKGATGKVRTFKTITWYAKNYGMVRNETYDDAGKMTGYSILTEYNKK
ncbi:MAG: hypothetical protein EAZ55_01590 [Cytophagales bacterium]|nr:MAG: hypothetical protein EAZ55_01590 [Cytophagales bacterium]